MKTYTLSMGALQGYSHPAPERTACKLTGWDYTYQVWPNRESMAKSIRMQERRAAHPSDWKALIPLTDGEGYGKAKAA
jgi:hypothetical protein